MTSILIKERQRKRSPYEDRGGDWRDVATSSGTPGSIRNKGTSKDSPLESLEGAQPC